MWTITEKGRTRLAAAEGEKVVVRWVATVAHRSPGLGQAPMGCQCNFRGMTWL
jgi:hypothetical protein